MERAHHAVESAVLQLALCERDAAQLVAARAQGAQAAHRAAALKSQQLNQRVEAACCR